jgi:hypothetical protein
VWTLSVDLNMANVEGYTRPLADYTVPVNELLEYLTIHYEPNVLVQG